MTSNLLCNRLCCPLSNPALRLLQALFLLYHYNEAGRAAAIRLTYSETIFRTFDFFSHGKRIWHRAESEHPAICCLVQVQSRQSRTGQLVGQPQLVVVGSRKTGLQRSHLDGRYRDGLGTPAGGQRQGQGQVERLGRAGLSTEHRL